ncbi:acyl transferase domain-containing protein/short-subunit dehydrogenase [Allocatelliglobosispora scoriae]|uniref:Acyl transferase domain-containing protein/short-subunit dehydrogenase n=1 Tax=Allocatelliglobosispora scoriae TaxID=643052 RepID=A0A841C163_9ACTN|nr:type I polyketide synthase [Allocatelliglobosispora scoriae]MBB5873478.1 acyl transferase domain-containing protein/short-subunit dehydrogenase [Allocatelliglobosispora scoriae]
MVGEKAQRAGTASKDGARTVIGARPAATGEPIAIVGMACRLPQAGDPAAFWRLLRGGVDAVTEAAEERWSREIVPDYRRGGFLDEVDRFDAGFFGISPNEAAAMDPQQRLVLELAWEALEQARIVPAGLRGTSAGVFIGAIAGDYAAMQDRLGTGGAHSYTGTHRAIIANRVSYVLGLRGASLTLDTGQSSSLVAVQMACESLRRGESGLALAGGVNLNLLAETTAAIGRFGALSADGRCHVFDERANGYVRGEGGALIVLKPLSAALRDGDIVHGVILGGAVNNDGGGDWLTSPSRQAQQDVIEQACAQAGVTPSDVAYVELHGTGTKVGDPIEAAALGAALGAGRPAKQPLLVGSVKTNIGHLEGAAGIAGLLKVVLSLKHGEVPATVGFARPNPEIPLDELRLRVVQETQPWPGRSRIAGVSSFGMGGTNCHLVIGAPPAPEAAPPAAPSARPVTGRPDLPWVLSARSAPALRAQARRLHEHLTASPDLTTPDIALALLHTRAELEHRAVVVGGDLADRTASLASLAAGQPDSRAIIGSATRGRTVFVFPGQGSQWPEMARDLLDTSPEFAARLTACDEALSAFVDYSLLDVLRGRPGTPDFARVDVVQPALWAVMVSLAELWRARGVHPEVVIGHSQGEIAAATVSGALSLADGARVVALRSRAINAIAGSGGMMSVAAPIDVVEAAVGRLAPDATVAAYNGSRGIVVSGTTAALAELEREFTAADHRTRIVPVDYASHSVAVEQIRDELRVALAPIRPVSTETLFLSTLTGEPIDTARLDADYWFRSLRNPVRFWQATQVALELGCGLFVECSPHPGLVAALQETIEEAERDAAVVGTLRRNLGGPDQFDRSLAEAYAAGATVAWDRTAPVDRQTLIDLPTYPFQRQRHWLTQPGEAAPARRGAASAVAEPVESEQPAPTRSRRELRDLVLATTASALGHADARAITNGAAFKELGVDSATAIELRNRLRAATGLALPTGLLFDYPTPDQVTDHLLALGNRTAGGTATAARSTVDADGDPIVVVAMGCRYPGDVLTPEDLWALVGSGAEAIGDFPVNRGWDVDALFATGPERSGTSDTRRGGFLRDADQFDAGFFGISPREASAMDPQQRLLLEICWETVERAGIDHESLRGSSTGVFVGAMASDYGPRLHQAGGAVDGHLLTGTALSVASGRIAYTLGLEGPALTVDTACSSSLVAIHLAVQALRRGECTLALAGGVTVMSTPGMFVEFSRQGGLAVDGRCKAFGADADGTGWGEGAGMLLLERRSDAQRNGHQILAVIRGSAVNQDGRSNGMTAPNGPAQERVIRQALADARLSPRDVDVVEAHGTGTKLGDPIEAQALLATYGQDRPADQPLWLGSLKSNIGHTQAAAGVGGVIKMVLAMRHGVLPATLHADESTPHVDWSGGAVALLTKPVAIAPGRTIRAGVSSFGISGTNAHLILEQAPAAEPGPAPVGETGPLVWVLSARSSAALRAQAGQLHDFAMCTPAEDLPAAAVELARRTRFEHRAVVVAGDRDELLAALAALAEGTGHPSLTEGVAGTDLRPVFVFPGQGSQWAGMAVELMDGHPGFRAELLRCDAALRAYTPWSVVDVLRGTDGAPALDGSEVVQPVLFAVMMSLAALWRELGVEPASVIGHSQGEIAAACVSGALSLQDGARIVALRSRMLMRLTGSGGMTAVALPAARVEEMLAPWSQRLWVAIHNGPTSTVIAGDPDALDEFAAACDESVQVRRLPVDYASHTPHIESLHDELLDVLAGVAPHTTEVGFCSAMEGRFIETSELTADYWYRSLRHPVQFEDAIRTFAGRGTPLFIEASPHPALTGHVQDTLRDAGDPGDSVGSLRRGDGGWRRFLTSASQAFVLGAPVDWSAALAPAARRDIDLPTYPFEHRRYWIEGDTAADVSASGLTTSGHPLLGAVVPLAEGGGHLLTGRISRGATPWLTDHAVDGSVLLPGTAFVELALEAATVAGCDLIEELTLEAPLVLPETGAVQVQLTVGADDEGRRSITVFARPADDPEGGWTRHATGTLGTAAPAHLATGGEWPPADAVPVYLDDAYEQLAEGGYEYGPAFQGLVGAWRTETDAYVEVELPAAVRDDADLFTLHPALLDAALHLLVLTGLADAGDGSLLLPFHWSGVHVAARGAQSLRVRLTGSGEDRVGLTIHDSAGQPVATAEALTLLRVPRRSGALRPRGQAVPYAIDWTDLSLPETDLAGQRWALVVGDGSADGLGASLTKAGLDIAVYYDLPSLADMTAGDVPGTVVVAYTPEIDPDDLAYSVREGIYPVIDLLQAWVGDDRFTGSRLVFATRGAFDTPLTTDGLAHAPLWGLVRAAQVEHPGRFALLDLDEGDCNWGLAAAAMDAGETQLVARDGGVRVPRLARRDLPADAVATEVDPAGTVLVTGGTGGLGALVAQRLVERHGVRHLLLTSRRGAATPGADELVTVLSELGASVTIAACDVADRRALAKLLAAIPAEHPLTGVVHAAGILDDATVQGLSAQRIDSVFRPKVDAGWLLHEQTRDLPLKLFVLFSSIAGVLGNPGQGNYAAANVFLDGLAEHRHGLGLPATSIAWGLWATATSMTGGLDDADVARLGRSGIAPLSSEQGLDLLDAALASPDAVVVASRWDNAGLRARAESDLLTPMLRSLVRAPRRADTATSRPAAATSGGGAAELVARLTSLAPADARLVLVDLVRTQVAAVLGYASVDGVNADRAFSELGFDSLTAVELRNRLDAACGLRLPATLAFDYPTVAGLSDFLFRTLVPAPQSPDEALRASLDQVALALPHHDDATRGKVIAILHSTLARLEAGPAGATTVQDRIRSASDDEIFAFIDNQI